MIETSTVGASGNAQPDGTRSWGFLGPQRPQKLLWLLHHGRCAVLGPFPALVRRKNSPGPGLITQAWVTEYVVCSIRPLDKLGCLTWPDFVAGGGFSQPAKAYLGRFSGISISNAHVPLFGWQRSYGENLDMSPSPLSCG